MGKYGEPEGINDPPLEEDELGNALLGGLAGGAWNLLKTGAVDLGEVLVTEVGAHGVEALLGMKSDQGSAGDSGDSFPQIDIPDTEEPYVPDRHVEYEQPPG